MDAHVDTPREAGPRAPDDLSPQEAFGFQLGRLSRWWRSRLDEELKPLGLTQARWIVLVHLARGGANMTQTELARFVEVEGPTLVRVLDALEGLKLIARRPCDDDRRAKSIQLTAKGRSIIARIDDVAAGLRRDLLAGIPAEELEQCLRLFAQIRANGQEQRAERGT